MKRLLVPAALAALLLAGCGGSSKPQGPPDLVFVSTKDADYALFGSDADGKHVRRLTEEKGDPSSPAGLFFQIEPAWSPDGKRIAFLSGRDGVAHVFVMNTDGTGTRRITNTTQDDGRASWSPDGKYLIFGREGALFRAPVAGGPAVRVGRGLGSAADPAYSPDGKLIAYDYRKPGFSIRELYLMNADGTGIRQLTRLRQMSGIPAWSPDGKKIAFQSTRGEGGHYEIYTANADGTGVKQVTHSGIDAIQPAWSLDGKTIAFSRSGAIWTITGSEEQQLTSEKNNDSGPAYRPTPPE